MNSGGFDYQVKRFEFQDAVLAVTDRLGYRFSLVARQEIRWINEQIESSTSVRGSGTDIGRLVEALLHRRIPYTNEVSFTFMMGASGDIWTTGDI